MARPAFSHSFIFFRRMPWVLLAFLVFLLALAPCQGSWTGHLEAFPDQPPGHLDSSSLSPFNKGEFLLSQSRNEEAAALFRSLMSKGDAGGYVFRGLIRAYRNMGQLKAVRQQVDAFLEANPGSPGALYGLGYIFYLSEDIVKAEEYFKQAVASDARNALALNNWGAVLARKKSYTQAAEKVREAIQVNPSEPMFFRNLETIYRETGEPGLIFADYQKYLEQGAPELARGYGKAVARSLRQKSFQLYAQGRLDDAITQFLEVEKVYKAIEHGSGLVPVYFSLGLLYEEKGDAQSAQKFYKRVLKINPLHLQAKDRLNRLH